MTPKEIIDAHKHHDGIDYYYKSEIISMMEAYAEIYSQDKYQEGYSKGYSDAQKEAVQEIRDHYSPNR